ncbi:stress-related protein-like [Impatiens glandulifera]|uniref:stress-related protein-like n=1 Tax=Impatiens glandulifera TaxID=253017 RepID=UPI001FB08538|nr:stress-related protein-like [Impatiens glandulifera]
MAELEETQTTEETLYILVKVSNEEEETTTLKYLDFVQDGALYAISVFSSLYEFAKANSGQLKPGVETVEGTVKAVVSPVLYKFHDVPSDLLKFVDLKVDESIRELEGHVPLLIKRASSQALMAAQKAPEVARAVAMELQRSGVADTAVEIAKTVYSKCEPTAKEMYVNYEPVAEYYAVIAWRFLNDLPLFPQMAGIVLPTAAHWADKYNEAVSSAVDRGYTLVNFMPMVPIERIAKIFENSPYEPCSSSSSSEEEDHDAMAVPQ